MSEEAFTPRRPRQVSQPGGNVSERVAVGDLRRGMFVAELDRPWLGTPFLIQGFLIEDDVQIRQLQQCCQHVYVDPSRSAGIDLPGAPQEKPDVSQAPRLAVTTRTVSLMRDGPQQRPDFYEVLRFVRAKNEARRTGHFPGQSQQADHYLRRLRLWQQWHHA